MPKNAYFLEKSCKLAAALGASPSNPHQPPDSCFVFKTKDFTHNLFVLL